MGGWGEGEGGRACTFALGPLSVCVCAGRGILLNWSQYISVYNKVKPIILLLEFSVFGHFSAICCTEHIFR